jgi:Putative peptidoglycan binding domain
MTERPRGKLRSPDGHERARDDWLAEQGDLDWRDPRQNQLSPATERPPPPVSADRGYPVGRSTARRPVSPERGRSPGGAVDPAAIASRRKIAALATLAIALVTAIAIAIGTSGGGSGKSRTSTVAKTVPTPTTTTPNPPAASTSPTPTGKQPTTPAQTQPTPLSRPLKVTLPASGTLSIGDTGPTVVVLQKALAALGLATVKPDGRFGSATEAAVIKFQTTHGLKPDGIVGATTAQNLNNALAATRARG